MAGNQVQIDGYGLVDYVPQDSSDKPAPTFGGYDSFGEPVWNDPTPQTADQWIRWTGIDPNSDVAKAAIATGYAGQPRANYNTGQMNQQWLAFQKNLNPSFDAAGWLRQNIASQNDTDLAGRIMPALTMAMIGGPIAGELAGAYGGGTAGSLGASATMGAGNAVLTGGNPVQGAFSGLVGNGINQGINFAGNSIFSGNSGGSAWSSPTLDNSGSGGNMSFNWDSGFSPSDPWQTGMIDLGNSGVDASGNAITNGGAFTGDWQSWNPSTNSLLTTGTGSSLDPNFSTYGAFGMLPPGYTTNFLDSSGSPIYSPSTAGNIDYASLARTLTQLAGPARSIAQSMGLLDGAGNVNWGRLAAGGALLAGALEKPNNPLIQPLVDAVRGSISNAQAIQNLSVPGITPSIQRGIDLTGSSIGAWRPSTDAAGNLIARSGGPLSLDRVTQLSGPMLDPATKNYGAYNTLATNYTTAGGSPISGSDIAGYMNPYTDLALAPAARQINEAAALKRQSDAAAAGSRGAFGTSRNDQVLGLDDRNKLLALGDLYGTGYKSAFDTALSASAADKARMLQAGSTFGGLSTNAGNLAEGAWSTGLSGANTEANRTLAAGTASTDLAKTIGGLNTQDINNSWQAGQAEALPYTEELNKLVQAGQAYSGAVSGGSNAAKSTGTPSLLTNLAGAAGTYNAASKLGVI